MSRDALFWMQIFGGTFYLLNKICLSFKERKIAEARRRWNILAWAVYIIGLPFWLVILGYEENWMVTFVEAGGLPAMLLGLIIAWRRIDETPTRLSQNLEKYFDYFARVAAVVGIAFSVYHLGLMTRVSQWLELGVSIGFLVGTYRLAKEHLDGYLWFFLMNLSAGLLMLHQGYSWLFWQQLASLAFVVDAYRFKRCRQRLSVRVLNYIRTTI